MRVNLRFLVMFVLVLVMAQVCVAGETFDHTLEVKDMRFSWTLDAANLRVEISAKTDAWVGIGFNPTQSMKDANFILGYVRDGKVSVADHFGTSSFQHMEDTKLGGAETISAAYGTEANGVTTIGFTLPLNSGDSRDQIIAPAGDTTVLLAYGSGRDSFNSKHRFRTRLTVNLATGAFR